MPASARTYLGAVLGTVMAGLGLFVVVRLAAMGQPPLTGALWLDIAFALFFLVRGGMYFRALRGARTRPSEGSGARRGTGG